MTLTEDELTEPERCLCQASAAGRLLDLREGNPSVDDPRQGSGPCRSGSSNPKSSPHSATSPTDHQPPPASEPSEGISRTRRRLSRIP
jgi:hypothetical protein